MNFFQPSFKLKSKIREGAKVTKKYHLPATPYERLLASDRVTEQCKDKLRQVFATLDPVELLNRIREAQRNLDTPRGWWRERTRRLRRNPRPDPIRREFLDSLARRRGAPNPPEAFDWTAVVANSG